MRIRSLKTPSSLWAPPEKPPRPQFQVPSPQPSPALNEATACTVALVTPRPLKALRARRRGTLLPLYG